ncbi:gluconate 2-dehydrogenase [Actinopolyspora xinjiangensis]|uniref:Gluconate 2-dehydrogenase n=1 Tax=Actinopolyspora xinjiangensis TaxID=405564 RepID=A0A1H0X2G9_9ACTN|nr:D-isomer specific 2-hydroxyacid dehydrogenase family protein [Actinopolyspora xinjiangensis]SDP96915.1 gluconate 2-dehydrogenase [Actinopolyspora xinjiangensis]
MTTTKTWKLIVSGGSMPTQLIDYCKHNEIEIDHLESVPPDDELRRRVSGADFYLHGGDERLSAEVLDAAPSLKAVSFLGTGAGSFVDLDAARERSVQVLTTPGVNSASVAEFAVGLALGLQRRIFADLQGRGKTSRASTELTGSTVGVLGLGATGTALARLLTGGFSCEVLYHSRTRKPDVEAELGVTAVDLDELFTRCTTVFVCASLTPETTGLVGEAQLGESGPDFLVSTADPKVVDPAALRMALESGALSGATMDGYYTEPLPVPAEDEHGLLALDTVFATSHIAASSENAWSRMEDMAVDNLIMTIEQSTAQARR